VTVRTWINVLGATNTLSGVAYVTLSFGLAPAAWFGAGDQQVKDVYAALAQKVGGGPLVAEYLGGGVLADRAGFVLAYTAPLLLTSGVFVTLLLLLAHRASQLDLSLPRLLFKWAAAWAVLYALAAPVLAPDFWWYLAWGRLIAAGSNPYQVALRPEFSVGLPVNAAVPLDDVGLAQFAYGPIWAITAAGVTAVSGGHGVFAALLLKLCMAAAWIAGLALVGRLLRRESAWRQCAGISLLGWLPLGLFHGLADGHNDVLVPLFVLLWLHGMEQRRQTRATLALAASVLIKYVTAPLFVLDLVQARAWKATRLRAYAPPALAAAGLAAFAFAPFLRSPHVFDAVLEMGHWSFFTPRDAVSMLEWMLGMRHVLSPVIPLVFPLIAVSSLVAYLRRPDQAGRRKAVLALLCGVVFGAGHMWPWFLLWVLAPAAVMPTSRLTRWVLGVALAAPFAMLPVVVSRGAPALPIDLWAASAVAMYVFALVWFVLAPSSWFGNLTSLRPESSGALSAHRRQAGAAG
jgi:alpha-1,6-mannosyltransferase